MNKEKFETMRKNEIDKEFLENSWQEMRTSLDAVLPQKRKSRKGMFWFLGLLLLVALPSYFIYHIEGEGEQITKITSSPKKYSLDNDIAHHTQIAEKKDNNISEESISNKILDAQEEIVTEQKRNKLQSATTSEVKKMFNIEGNRDNPLIKKLRDKRIHNEENYEDDKVKRDLLPFIDFKTESKTTTKNVAFEIPSPLSNPFYLVQSHLDQFANLNNLSFIVSENQKSPDRLSLEISGRIYNQTTLNGELGLNYNIAHKGRFALSIGLGLGFDNYYTAENIDVLQGVTYFNSTSDRMQGSFNASEILLDGYSLGERKRSKMYITPKLAINYDLSNKVNVSFGYAYRYFSGYLTADESLDSTPLSVGGNTESNAFTSSFSSTIRDRSRSTHFFQLGLGYSLTADFTVFGSIGFNPIETIQIQNAQVNFSNSNINYDYIVIYERRKELRLGMKLKI